MRGNDRGKAGTMGRLEIDAYNYDVRIDELKAVIRDLLQAMAPTIKAEHNLTKDQIRARDRARKALSN